MLKFGSTGFDPDFLSSPENLNFTDWFDSLPTDGEPAIAGIAVDNPLTGLSLQLDGGVLDALFAEEGATVDGNGVEPGGDIAPGFETGIFDGVPEMSISAAGAFEPGEQIFFATQVSEDFATGFRAEQFPINAIPFPAEAALDTSGAPANSDLIFLDFGASGKGGVPGGNGGGKGGGGGGGGGDPDVLSSYTSGDAGGIGFNIEINFKGSWISDLQTAFIDASELISDLITGDIADVFFRGKIIDDIRIDAKLIDIDGEGGILGRAGPTAIRTDGFLPATAIMEFDVADAANFNTMPSGSEGTLWDDIVTHEMMHTIGFGTIWTYLDLLSGGGTANPIFTGEFATTEYEAALGLTAGSTAGVPVEGDGGAGTRDSHWDEETFGNEIMTGYINNSDNLLSEMTVASLEDLGYDTTWTAPPVDGLFIA